MKDNNVTLINHSSGGKYRQSVQDSLEKRGCQGHDLKARYQLDWELDKARLEYLKKQNVYSATHVIEVMSAGNTGLTLESTSDTNKCELTGLNKLVVGAYDENGNIARFSNRGHCVDMYTLGANMIVAAPKGFLTVGSGTSFSAPLVVRYLSMNTAASTPVDKVVQSLLGLRDTKNQYLPKDIVPAGLSYTSKLSEQSLAEPPM